MRYVGFLAPLFAAFEMGSLASHLKHRPEVAFSAQLESVVHIINSTNKCTGFIIGRGLIATAGHCIRPDAVEQQVEFVDGTRAPYKTISYTNKPGCQHDWALITARTGKLRPLKLSVDFLPRGSSVWRVGYPANSERQLLKVGRILSYSVREFEMTNVAIPGESGAPVMDSDGYVHGIVTCYDHLQASAVVAPLYDLIAIEAMLIGRN